MTIIQLFKYSLSSAAFFTLFLFSSCNSTVNAPLATSATTSTSNASGNGSSIASPSITQPASSPTYTSLSSQTIAGTCLSGDTVILSGDSSATQTCTGGGTFSFSINKGADGIYVFSVAQADGSGNESAAVAVVWERKTTVAPPSITAPTIDPFSSSGASVTISGGCETGSTVTLAGDSSQTFTCAAAAYSFTVPKGGDGTYHFTVSQTDLAANTSTNSSLTWNKQVVVASPSVASIAVNASQTFTATGGSGSYTFSFAQNNSGGTLDSSSGAYTAGLTLGVDDHILITDSLGATATATVHVIAGAADHLALISGQSQTTTVGHALASHLKVQVQDRFGNAVSGKNLSFTPIQGDVQLVGSPIVSSDSQGYAQISLKIGYSAIHSLIEITAIGTALPDLAATGHATLAVGEISQASGIGTFLGQTALPAGLGSTITADLRANGKIDLITAGSNVLNVYFGNGDGTFQAPISYTIGNGAAGLASGDLNGDGYPDLVVANNNDNTIGILLNNGDGTFAPQTTLPCGGGAAGIALGDLRGNGHLDIVVAEYSGSSVGIFLGHGDGTFAAEAEISIAWGMQTVALQDVNADGIPDLITGGDSAAQVDVLMGNGDGTFQAAVTYPISGQFQAALVADLNHDGHPDIVAFGSSYSDPSWMCVLINNGNGTFQAHVDYPVATFGWRPYYLADLHGSGYLDAIVEYNHVADSTIPYFSVYPGVGDGTFGARVDYAGSNWVMPVVGQFRTGQKPDIALIDRTTGKPAIEQNNGNGTFTLQPSAPDVGTVHTVTLAGSPNSVVMGDFNGDGNQDMAVANAGSVSVFLGQGDGTFPTEHDYATGSSNHEIIAVDLNGDGNLDLVVTSSSTNAVMVLIGNGDGTFQNAVSYTVGAGPQSLVAGDFNGDGKGDLIVANTGDFTLSLLLGNGNGTFQAAQSITVLPGPYLVRAADFNQDGKLDLVFANSYNANLTMLPGNGNGTFGNPVTLAPPGQTAGLVIGDFNGDGYADIVVTTNAPSLNLFQGNGNGTFQAATTIGSTNSPSWIVSGDFNGDGKLDLAVVDTGLSAILLFQGNGSGSFSPKAFIPPNANNASRIAVGDANNDGKLDIVTSDPTDGAIYISLGN